MQLLHEIDFTTFNTYTDMIRFMKKHDFWLFYKTVSTNLNEQDIKEYLEHSPNYVQIKKKLNQPDPFKANLNSRTELRPDQWRFNPSQTHTVRVRTLFPDKRFNAEFLQIMSRSSKAGPIFQLEIRNGQWSCRANFEGVLRRYPVAPCEYNKWIEWDVEVRTDKKQGHVKVFKDGKLFWSKTGNNFYGTYAWLQFGIYSSGSDAEMNVLYKYLGLFKGEFHPPSHEGELPLIPPPSNEVTSSYVSDSISFDYKIKDNKLINVENVSVRFRIDN
jgi:hypothetical protein